MTTTLMLVRRFLLCLDINQSLMFIDDDDDDDRPWS